MGLSWVFLGCCCRRWRSAESEQSEHGYYDDDDRCYDYCCQEEREGPERSPERNPERTSQRTAAAAAAVSRRSGLAEKGPQSQKTKLVGLRSARSSHGPAGAGTGVCSPSGTGTPRTTRIARIARTTRTTRTGTARATRRKHVRARRLERLERLGRCVSRRAAIDAQDPRLASAPSKDSRSHRRTAT